MKSIVSFADNFCRIMNLTPLITFSLIVLLITPPMASAQLSDAQKRVLESEIFLFDTEYSECTTTGSDGLAYLASSNTGVPGRSEKDWVDKYGKMAYNTGQKYHIPYIAILAQAALESGWGNSGLTRTANNFFGIKAGSSWTGATVTMTTKEQTSSGSVYTVQAKFRAYADAQAGFDGYGEFITQNQRYRNALNYPNDPAAYINEIKKAGYATDVKYVSSNVSLQQKIEAYIVSLNDPSLPASKDVVYTTPSPTPATGGTPAPGSIVGDTGCSISGSTGSATILGDKAFPLAVKKSEVLNPESYYNSSVHGTYMANDILAKKGTTAVAIMNGTVRVSSNTDACSTRMVQLMSDSGISFYYMHLDNNIEVATGRRVEAGAPIGYITPGVNKPGYTGGCGVSHLHIDATKPGETRPSRCSRTGCGDPSVFYDMSSMLKELYSALPD